MHVRYTAREGGVPLRQAAVDNLHTLIEAGQATGSVRLLSVRQEFPTEWARFTAATTARAPLTLTLREEHYPFWATKLGAITPKQLTLFAAPGASGPVTVYDEPGATTPHLGSGLVAPDELVNAGP